MWRIWFNRNQVVHGMGKQDMAAVVDWSRCYLSDFRAANVVENKDGMSGKIRNVVIRWQPPTEGLYKVRFSILEAGTYGVSQSRKCAFIWAASHEKQLGTSQLLS
ncbi:hypothetical protein Q3G72_026624 [Acer saccharum]|nr:hypothetical protein Q3G72_026624 [Acer saccharum]